MTQGLFFLVTLDVLAYLASIGYLVDYLRRVHIMTWIDLGQPEFSVGAMRDKAFRSLQSQFDALQSAFKTIGFVFSNRYRKLQDPRVRVLIWTIRITFPAFFLLLALAIFVSWLEGS